MPNAGCNWNCAPPVNPLAAQQAKKNRNPSENQSVDFALYPAVSTRQRIPMTHAHPDEAETFPIAREISAPDARAAYLRQACGDDRSLHERVVALLKIAAEEQSFLESPAAAPFVPTITEGPVAESAGT